MFFYPCPRDKRTSRLLCRYNFSKVKGVSVATNTVHELGTNLEVVAPGKLSGQAFAYGQIPGVLETTPEAVTNRAVMQTVGVYRLPVATATTVGAILYYVVADGTLTTTVGSNIRFGYALDAQGGAGTIRVKVGY